MPRTRSGAGSRGMAPPPEPGMPQQDAPQREAPLRTYSRSGPNRAPPTVPTGSNVSEMLRDLPSFNSENFSRVRCDRPLYGSRSDVFSRQKTALASQDYPPELQKPIVTERTNILLRFIHKQWDPKSPKKREVKGSRAAASDGSGTGTSTQASGEPVDKEPRRSTRHTSVRANGLEVGPPSTSASTSAGAM